MLRLPAIQLEVTATVWLPRSTMPAARSSGIMVEATQGVMPLSGEETQVETECQLPLYAVLKKCVG